jgi:hypothetical protein
VAELLLQPMPCEDDTYLNQLQEDIYPLAKTNSLRSQHIEVFPADVNSFTDAIWQAHLELIGAPWFATVERRHRWRAPILLKQSKQSR